MNGNCMGVDRLDSKAHNFEYVIMIMKNVGFVFDEIMKNKFLKILTVIVKRLLTILLPIYLGQLWVFNTLIIRLILIDQIIFNLQYRKFVVNINDTLNCTKDKIND